jgi:hypothetical protein
MARNYSTSDALYRVVCHKEYFNHDKGKSEGHTEYFGPYTSKSDAQRQGTRQVKEFNKWREHQDSMVKHGVWRPNDGVDYIAASFEIEKCVPVWVTI